MDCQISRAEDVAQVVLIGSLDSSWAPYLSDRLDEVVRTGVREVLLDMSGVSYLSSNGIALLVRYHREMRLIGGSFRIVEDSEAVGHVLKLTGVAKLLRDEGPIAGAPACGAQSSITLDRAGMTLQVFKSDTCATVERLERIGDPTKLTSRGYGAADDREWRAAAGNVALGLGALGPGFEACRDRYGEFLAAAGVAVYRPSEGPGRPDFERATGAFIPQVRVLYGLAFSVGLTPILVRFEANGEPLNRSVALSQLADACLDQSETRTAGMVLIGEADGLVGTALRRSPVAIPDGTDPFAHPDAREWLSMTSEPEHARSTALVVGVATRAASPALAPFVRPLVGSSMPELQGHFHAAVVPFRPLPRGSFEIAPTVQRLFDPGRVETVLHLLGDSRPILGAGESTFARGAFWFVPLNDEG
ncbi:MAG: STAS domain-containing protein [Isosphaeraceae bacterium]|nr:STAS domain-containing protein [Isosphaeraceae bacterium]